MARWVKKKYDWVLMRLRFLRRRCISPGYPKNENGTVRLHVGCGKRDYPGFINVDALPFPHVHIITDRLSNLSDFSNDSVDLVYMCHIMEHLKLPELVAVLKEMNRILKPGGRLQMSVPDFDKLLKVYHASGDDLESIRFQLMGAQDSPYNCHYTPFTKKSMTRLLEQTGFTDIGEWDPEKLDFEVKDKSLRRMRAGDEEILISLNLCAHKSKPSA